MGPDETASNRLDAVFEATERVWMEPTEPYDVHLAQGGRVMEVLSEHLCQGWLEGYLLTGRHGFFSCYEAFIHIVDSMFNQHAKWLKVSRELTWRRPIASLNYLLTSHVWRQDHNGFSHQDPGFVDLVTNKKADIVRVYFPPDANTLLWVADHCLRTYDRINVIIAGKQPAPQWLSMQDAATHCDAGIGIWTWAGTESADGEPDVVMACAGDVPTVETLAAVDLLRKALPDLKIRVVNVVDLMTLQSKEQHPHGLSDRDFDSLFTRNKPVIFAYHGYPYLIHRLTYSRANHAGMHVRGFAEKARPPRRSTWSCSTSSTAIISRSRRSSACPGSRRKPRTSSSSSATGCSNIRATCASTARICQRSATGCGRTAQADRRGLKARCD